MTGSAFRAVAPVSAVCAAFTTQPSAYPPRGTKPDVAPPCGSATKAASTEEDRLRAVFGGERSRKRRSRRKGLALFCASPSTSARSAGSFGRSKRPFSARMRSGLALIFGKSQDRAVVAGTILALFVFGGGERHKSRGKTPSFRLAG